MELDLHASVLVGRWGTQASIDATSDRHDGCDETEDSHDIEEEERFEMHFDSRRCDEWYLASSAAVHCSESLF